MNEIGHLTWKIGVPVVLEFGPSFGRFVIRKTEDIRLENIYIYMKCNIDTLGIQWVTSPGKFLELFSQSLPAA